MMDLRTPEARPPSPDTDRALRHDWTRGEALALYEAPFNDLLFRAHTVHRRFFDPNTVQMSRLLSIKTGGCAEDCGYCSQSAHHASGSQAPSSWRSSACSKRQGARAMPAPPATAWARPGARPRRATWISLCAMVEGVKALGLETCMTLGMLSDDDVVRLKDGRPRLLQPQHRYLRALLQRDHHHAHLRRPAGDASACARGRHQGVRRRYRRHGRRAGRPRRHAGDAGQPARSIPKACRSTC